MRDIHRITFQEWVDTINGEGSGAVRPLIITDEEVAVFLAGYADMMAMKPCPIPTCSGCEEAQRYWWDWCNSLSGPVRIRLQRHLREVGVPLPRHPGDDIDLSSARR